jgi:uncharacterized repeat protein (TIGR03803 family)
MIGMAVVAVPLSQAQTFGTLTNFSQSNGAWPYYMSLAQNTNGNLYGTASSGGSNGYGIVFDLSTAGTEGTLTNFNSTNGATPLGGLALGTDGNLYGTTSYGGSGTNNGTFFKVTSTGIATLLSFTSADGGQPSGTLVQGTDGNFYGTTVYGGASNYGTVFKITPTGTLTTLHSFSGSDGEYPYAGLIQGTDGNFYGTTEQGGSSSLYGTVYKITSAGTLTTLHSFTSSDGANPYGGLVQATDGNFYGTTEAGGPYSCGCGTVFKITSAGTLTTIYDLGTGSSDGANPYAGLIQGTDGNLYGTTSSGGTYAHGAVFKITTAGTMTTLHSFCSTLHNNYCTDGNDPTGGLAQDTNGTFYGTTFAGGTYGYGTVFSLSDGLGAFVKTVPTSGAAGTSVIILGTSLTGATKVTFNGTAATFTVVSAYEITTKVPTGATTGTVKVTTPSGTLSSNVVFIP